MIKKRRFFSGVKDIHSIGSLEEVDGKRSNKSAINEAKKVLNLWMKFALLTQNSDMQSDIIKI